MTGVNWDSGGEPHCDFLLWAGQEIGAIDVGHGPARAVSPSEVVSIAAALPPVDAFATKFDHAALISEDVYCVSHDAESEREYVCENYAQLNAFVSSAAAADKGLILSQR